MLFASDGYSRIMELGLPALFATYPEGDARTTVSSILILLAYLTVCVVLWVSRRRPSSQMHRTFTALPLVIGCFGIIQALTPGLVTTPLEEIGRWVCITALCFGVGFLSYLLFQTRERDSDIPSTGRSSNACTSLATTSSDLDGSIVPLSQPIPEPRVQVTPALSKATLGFSTEVDVLGEDRFQLLFERNPHPAWVFDAESLAFLAVNDAAINRYGYTREEFLKMTLRDVVDGDDINRVVTSAAMETERDMVLPWRHRTKAGVLLGLEVVSNTLTFASQAVRLVVAADIADRRRTEGALREREELFRNVIANIPCGVFWKDRASVYLGCNDQVARDYGLAVRGEVVGQTDFELAVIPEEAESSRTSDRRVIDSRAPLLNVEEAHTRRDGRKAALLVSRVPLHNSTGEVLGVLGVYQDVTERKRLEEQLRQAQKMEAIGRLAGGIAHDFNNLLTIIFGNAHLLRQLPSGSADIPQLIDDIHDAADRAASLTRQLLTFSRRQPSRPEVIDLSEVVASLAGLLRRLLGERISVRTQVAPDPVRVRADRGQLEQVVMNLAVNARDAMPGGGTLSIATSSVTAPSGPGNASTRFVRLTISDTGVGMTDEVKARIFEPFFTTKEPGKGTGLGLATVYGIVEQAGGHIEVESAPGAGTTFRIGLPWCDSLPRPSAIIGVRNSVMNGNAGQGKTVLLAEDEEGIRKLARFALEAYGYIVVEAGDAEAAIPLITLDRPIDLLITDLVMPGMDGRELASRVRSVYPEVGVVFISGYVPDAHRLEGLPGALFLPKPFNPGDLVRMAARAIRRSMSANETLVGPGLAVDNTASGD